MTGYDLALKVAKLALEKKALNVKIIHLKGVASMCDYFVVATGSVDQHVKAIAEHIRKDLSKLKIKPLGYEGQSNLRWVLLDYVDVVAHVFDPASRDLYDLDRLWPDAEIEVVEEPTLLAYMIYLVLDIGNTEVHLGFYNEDYSNLGSFRLKTHDDFDSSALSKIIIAETKKFNIIKIDVVLIATVVPKRALIYKEFFQTAMGVKTHIICHADYTSLKHSYDDITKLGIDRLCSVAAVKRLFGASVVSIDFGTAITFEVVDKNGDFSGGLIVPGIGLMSECLSTKTALLPQVQPHFPPAVIGTNTIDSINSGIMFGVLELCKGVIRKVTLELSTENIKVVATGGYAHLFYKRLESGAELIPDLVLQGALTIFLNKSE